MAFKEDVAAALARAAEDTPGATWEVEYAPGLGWLEPSEVPADHPMVVACQRAAEAILGTAPPLAAFPGGTDAFRFHAIGGIPTLAAFGPGQLPLAHGPNEWVSVTGLVQAMRMYALVALDYGASA
jgi:acetylornithine deacetylase/succinyl-diaminopimelate desuccinylase-like protein